jgi:hypothetical protein
MPRSERRSYPVKRLDGSISNKRSGSTTEQLQRLQTIATGLDRHPKVNLNYGTLNFEPPQGFERSEAIERLERLERTIGFRRITHRRGLKRE